MEGSFPVRDVSLFFLVKTLGGYAEILKLSPSLAATKWYPYSPNQSAGNDSLLCPLQCPGIHLMPTSKIREISDL